MLLTRVWGGGKGAALDLVRNQQCARHPSPALSSHHLKFLVSKMGMIMVRVSQCV